MCCLMCIWFSLFQMWRMQTRQPEGLDGITSSLPLRRYFLSCYKVRFILHHADNSLLAPCLVQFYACDAVLEEQGLFEGKFFFMTF